MTAMDFTVHLAQLNLAPAVQSDLEKAVRVQIAALQEQAKRELEQHQARLKAKDAEIHAKDIKIQALVLELAHLRRMRYGAKSEALAQVQQDLFEDSRAEDLAAVQAELDQATAEQPVAPAVKPKRPRAGRQPLPPHLPRIEHRHEPESCQCGQCGKDLVKIGEDITEQLEGSRLKRPFAIGRGAREVLRPPPHSPPVCLQGLRDRHGGTDSARRHRRRHSGRWLAGLGVDR
jgi:hypothetical protein